MKLRKTLRMLVATGLLAITTSQLFGQTIVKIQEIAIPGDGILGWGNIFTPTNYLITGDGATGSFSFTHTDSKVYTVTMKIEAESTLTPGVGYPAFVPTKLDLTPSKHVLTVITTEDVNSTSFKSDDVIQTGEVLKLVVTSIKNDSGVEVLDTAGGIMFDGLVQAVTQWGNTGEHCLVNGVDLVGKIFNPAADAMLLEENTVSLAPVGGHSMAFNNFIFQFSTYVARPDTPTDIIVSKITENSFDLSWADMSAEGYEVVVSTNSDIDITADLVDSVNISVNGLGATVSNLISNTEYYYWVRAADADVYSFYSETAEQATNIDVDAAPTNLSRSGNVMSWDAVVDYNSEGIVAGYEVDLSADNFTTSVDGYPKTVTDATVTLDALVASTQYSFRVRVEFVENGLFSEYSSATFIPEANGLAFNGTNSRVEIPHSDKMMLASVDTGFTIAAWIKPSSLESSLQDIVARGKNGSKYKSWSLSLVGDKLAAYIGSGTGEPNKYTANAEGSTSLVVGEWTHVAMTYEISSKAIKLYINGVAAQDFGNDPLTASTFGDSQATVVQLGGDSGRWYFSGAIDEVSVWNKILTETQLPLIADEPFVKGNTPPSRSGEPLEGAVTGSQISDLYWSDLLLYMPLDEGSGTTTSDLSDTPTNDGTIVGTPVWTESAFAGDGILTPAVGLNVVQEGTTVTWTIESQVGVEKYIITDASGKEYIIDAKEGTAEYSQIVSVEGEVTLTVVDSSGYSQTFLPADGNIIKVVYDLVEGWNLIAIAGDNACTDELGTLWGWNGESYEMVDAPEAGQAVWVYSAFDVQVIVAADKSEATLDLNAGWNMVGPTVNMQVPVEAHTVYGWTGIYQTIADEGTLLQGVGYWIFCAE